MITLIVPVALMTLVALLAMALATTVVGIALLYLANRFAKRFSGTNVG